MKNMTKGELSTTPFNIIQNSDILTQEDFDILIPLTGELQESFKKSQVFRTRTEMEVSVLNDVKFPTHASKYWQSVREQNVMFSELVMLSYEYRKNMVEIKKLERDLNGIEDLLDKELSKIEIEKKMFISKNQERTAKDRIRELKDWSEIKEREAKKMTEDELEAVDKHQLISYTKRFINQKMISGNSGSPAEKQNLDGQLISAVRECKKRNVLDTVMIGYNEQVKEDIKLLT